MSRPTGGARYARLTFVLVPQLNPTEPSAGPPVLIKVRGSRVDVTGEDGSEVEAAGPRLFVGALDGRHCWAVESLGGDEVDPPDSAYVDLMRLYPMVDEVLWAAAGRAVQLVAWERNHRFCGHCGQATEISPAERSRRCPRCGLAVFPRLAPAVIALVERQDGKALLARNAGWPTAMYSCLAGFVEPGESAEDAVRREIHEEVGVSVGRLSYFASQPWPFPHSLMLGYHVEFGGGEIECDGVEISDAQWFSPDELPEIPGPISIARRLIDDWIRRSA